jgi:hypothetical protein
LEVLIGTVILRRNNQTNFSVNTINSPAAAIKNKSGLELRRFLLENAVSFSWIISA